MTVNGSHSLGPAFPAWAGSAERLRFLLGHAILAPSRHNSQPWSFEIEGSELLILMDRRRALPATDPSGRAQVLACGAALENLVVAAAHYGHGVTVDHLPEGEWSPLLARVRLGERRRPTAEEEARFPAIAARRTAAGFLPGEVDRSRLLALAGQAAAAGCRVRAVREVHSRSVAEIVAGAEATQWGSAAYRAEAEAWARSSRPRVARTFPRGPRAPGVFRRLLGRFAGKAEERDRRLGAETRNMLVLSTRGDGPADWLTAGQALQRLLLAATTEGILAAFYSAPIEIPDARLRLRRAVFEPAWPQLLLRLGHGPTPRPTPRRHVDLALRQFSSAPGWDLPLDDLAAASAAAPQRARSR